MYFTSENNTAMLLKKKKTDFFNRIYILDNAKVQISINFSTPLINTRMYGLLLLAAMLPTLLLE